MNFDGKMKLRVDFLKGSLAVNFEFWVLTESYVKSFFYKILTVNIEFWLKNEMKSCFLTGFLTVNIEFWRLSEMKSWYIDGFEFDQSLLKNEFFGNFLHKFS